MSRSKERVFSFLQRPRRSPAIIFAGPSRWTPPPFGAESPGTRYFLERQKAGFSLDFPGRQRFQRLGAGKLEVHPYREDLAIGDIGLESEGFTGEKAVPRAGKRYVEPRKAESRPEADAEHKKKRRRGKGSGHPRGVRRREESERRKKNDREREDKITFLSPDRFRFIHTETSNR